VRSGVDRWLLGWVAAVAVQYRGAIVTANGLALIALAQVGTSGTAALVGAVSMLIDSVKGNLVTAWLSGRASRMNPVMIIVGVLAFGWLRDRWGHLPGKPLITVAKSVCDDVEDLEPIGESLGE
jgi:predicted PurR-regulated permease PerM